MASESTLSSLAAGLAAAASAMDDDEAIDGTPLGARDLGMGRRVAIVA